MNTEEKKNSTWIQTFNCNAAPSIGSLFLIDIDICYYYTKDVSIKIYIFKG